MWHGGQDNDCQVHSPKKWSRADQPASYQPRSPLAAFSIISSHCVDRCAIQHPILHQFHRLECAIGAQPAQFARLERFRRPPVATPRVESGSHPSIARPSARVSLLEPAHRCSSGRAIANSASRRSMSGAPSSTPAIASCRGNSPPRHMNSMDASPSYRAVPVAMLANRRSVSDVVMRSTTATCCANTRLNPREYWSRGGSTCLIPVRTAFGRSAQTDDAVACRSHGPGSESASARSCRTAAIRRPFRRGPPYADARRRTTRHPGSIQQHATTLREGPPGEHEPTAADRTWNRILERACQFVT